MGSKEGFDMLFELAKVLHAEVGASRAAVDAGFCDHDRQIGQSGETVSPDLMLNIAISGSVQYQLGMQKAKCIVAINQSEDAPIYDIAHIGAVTDYKKLVPALIAEIKARKQ